MLHRFRSRWLVNNEVDGDEMFRTALLFLSLFLNETAFLNLGSAFTGALC